MEKICLILMYLNYQRSSPIIKDDKSISIVTESDNKQQLSIQNPSK